MVKGIQKWKKKKKKKKDVSLLILQPVDVDEWLPHSGNNSANCWFKITNSMFWSKTAQNICTWQYTVYELKEK